MQRHKSKLQHQAGNRSDLKKGGDFPGPTRPDANVAFDKPKNNGADDENDIATDDNCRKPNRKFRVIFIAATPTAQTQGENRTQHQAFIGDRIENYTQRAGLFVVTRDVAVDPVTNSGDEESEDRRPSQPLDWLATLDGLPVSDCGDDKYRNQRNPEDRDLVRGRHWRESIICNVFPERPIFARVGSTFLFNVQKPGCCNRGPGDREQLARKNAESCCPRLRS